MSFATVQDRAWLSEPDCDLGAYRSLVERTTPLADFPHASSVERNVPVYDSERLRAADDRRVIAAELVHALSDGPGVVVSGAPLRTLPSSTARPRKRRAEGVGEQWLEHVIAASADGFPFPTDLDSDPPLAGLAPPSQADVVRRAVHEEWTPRALRDELRAGAERRAG